MEAGGLIAEAARQCVESFTKCLEVPALMENEWAENRLADMELWISGTGACARGRAALDSRLASRPEARDVITNLLNLLGTLIDECRMQSETDEPPHSHHDQEDDASSAQEGQDRAFSPWSDDSSSDDQSTDAYVGKKSPGNPLRESMYDIESMLDQLARIAVAVRRSGRRSRLQKADQRFDAIEHQELEGHLVGMLLTLLKSCPQERDSSKLNEVQLRLIRCNLKRRNRFLYAQNHSKGLDAGYMRHSSYTQIKQDGREQEEIIEEKPDSKPSNDGPKPANNTIKTGTSASKVSDSFNSQLDHAAPAASSIMSTTAVDLDYPLPPRFDDDAHLFRCPCCCEALPAKMADMNRWRKHVADDLSPYTCILSGCDQPDVLFNTKESWREHILNDHRSMKYWICFACGDGSQFNDKKAFVQHMKSDHAATILPDQIPLLIELSEKTTPTEILRCPLCSWPEEGVEVDKDVLLNHIAKDIHSFSLRSLPWADDNGQESDQRIHESSDKVYDWLIQNEVQAHPTMRLPPHEKKIWYSEYFQQNAYFVGSSQASVSSEVDSDNSREKELAELRREGESIVHESLDAPVLVSQGQKTEKDIEPVPGSAKPDPETYTVGWVCGIATDYVAAKAFLDETHSPARLSPDNESDYTLGRIGQHNVVISVTPFDSEEYPSSLAAQVAVDLIRSFPNIRICLMVGIGSGAPSPKHDIRLGDVVVNMPRDGQGGMINYEFGKTIQGSFQHTICYVPPRLLVSAGSVLNAQHEVYPNKLDVAVKEVFETYPRLRQKYQRPDHTSDRLYQSHIIHPADDEAPCATICGDDPSCLVPRLPRDEDDDHPVIYYGLIASARQVMRNALTRDKLAAEYDILCFETAAAGLMSTFPCLMIRGICDYADSHKNKEWQGYASMTAAAYAKDILYRLHPQQVEEEEKIIDTLKVWDRGDHSHTTFGGQNVGVSVGINHGQIKF